MAHWSHFGFSLVILEDFVGSKDHDPLPKHLHGHLFQNFFYFLLELIHTVLRFVQLWGTWVWLSHLGVPDSGHDFSVISSSPQRALH